MYAHCFITLLLHSLYIQNNLCFYYTGKKKRFQPFRDWLKEIITMDYFLKGMDTNCRLHAGKLKFREQKGLQTYAVRFVCLIRFQRHFICFQRTNLTVD